jgi:DNA adenine methylase
MAEVLAAIKGAFILSINDRPEIREVFGRFVCEEVKLSYSISAGGGTEAAELIVTNRAVRSRLL